MKYNSDDKNPFAIMGWKIDSMYAVARYNKCLPSESGLYALTYWDEKNQMHNIVYIGMSFNLKKRARRESHPVLRFLSKNKIHADIWFKTFPKDGLSLLETEMIATMNPSYNISKKVRSI